jgi:hypothetical protein
MSEFPGEKPDPRSSNTGMTPQRRDPAAGQRLDRDTLAALIDGRLVGTDRDVALASLAASPDDLEIVADVLAVADELDGSITDIRAHAAKREVRRPQLTRWLSVAAAAVLVVAALPVMLRNGSASRVDGYASLLASHAPLAPGWDSNSWSVTRGSSDGIAERTRAVRAGALTSAIDVAIARGDSATPHLASEMAALFVEVPGASSVVSTYKSMAASGTAVKPELARDARHAARAMVSAPAFDDGAWLEAARIAANDHDSTFFAAEASRAQLAGLERDTSGDARARDDVLAVGRLIERKDWDALALTTTNILASLAAP